jgi:hypothetical protein
MSGSSFSACQRASFLLLACQGRSRTSASSFHNLTAGPIKLCVGCDRFNAQDPRDLREWHR